ncbi:uncharacterized protein LOC127878597 isoform X2 [Dreissena polymorpha]|uniref:Uncharacterized protein n=1 Tax=Dreissena polymorpha TaxID=45954 RepID=A0A9D4MST5_DREPO|nr:uncharacterized protein LOC127878597 isoform X1 [Dreissena polymorpha]XP_052281093.1 uncharacterized protein LOC127878597 isoform X2 [Dreissena polymorpha]KAH3880602.1 hypothetical protein DPMN_004521 [Dreissena polymorpha]
MNTTQPQVKPDELGAHNTTDVTSIKEEPVEVLTIIVWSLGGVLLLVLLTLLVRIVLARNKRELDVCDYDQFGNAVLNTGRRRGRHTLRIFLDQPGSRPIDLGSPSRDTGILVPTSHPASTGTTQENLYSDPPPYERTLQPQNTTSTPTLRAQQLSNPHNNNNVPSELRSSVRTLDYMPDCYISPELPTNCEIITRQLRVGEYVNSLPVPVPVQQTAQLLRDYVTGSRASINGYVISPPSYRDVVNSGSRIPAVIIDTPRTRPDPRRLLFSL